MINLKKPLSDLWPDFLLITGNTPSAESLEFLGDYAKSPETVNGRPVWKEVNPKEKTFRLFTTRNDAYFVISSTDDHTNRTHVFDKSNTDLVAYAEKVLEHKETLEIENWRTKIGDNWVENAITITSKSFIIMLIRIFLLGIGDSLNEKPQIDGKR